MFQTLTSTLTFSELGQVFKGEESPELKQTDRRQPSREHVQHQLIISARQAAAFSF